MILVLSGFDLAVVVINHPILLISTMFWSMQSSNKVFGHIIGPLITIQLGGLSMLVLLALNIKRFLALRYQFFHQRAMTKTRIKIRMFGILDDHTSQFVAIKLLLRDNNCSCSYNRVCISFLCAFTFKLYKMFVIAKSKSENRRVSAGSTAISSNHETKARKLNIKTISTCCLSVGCFFICSLPQIVFSTWRTTSNNPWNDRQVKLLAIWCNTFVFMNSTFNCLIFFWRNSILRREGIRTAKCLWTQ